MSTLTEEAEIAMQDDLSEDQLNDVQLERIYQNSLNPVVDEIPVIKVIDKSSLSDRKLKFKSPKEELINEIQDIGIELYGDGNVDASINNKDANAFSVKIKFKDIDITNGRGGSTRIEEIIMILHFSDFTISNKVISSALTGASGVRTKYSDSHYNSRYHHSHLPSNDPGIVAGFCLGTGELAKIVGRRISERKDDFLDSIYSIFMAAKDYIVWESIAGGPYYTMSSIAGRSALPVPSIYRSAVNHSLYNNTYDIKLACKSLGIDIYSLIDVNIENGALKFKVKDPLIFFTEIDVVNISSANHEKTNAINSVFCIDPVMNGSSYSVKKLTTLILNYNNRKDSRKNNKVDLTKDNQTKVELVKREKVRNGFTFNGKPVYVIVESIVSLSSKSSSELADDAEWELLTNSLKVKVKNTAKLAISNMMSKKFIKKINDESKK